MTKGRLRVLLGAAPGVGTTSTMLEEGGRLAAEGRDVVIAVVETHGRRETEALLDGLEVVPRRRVEYRGQWLEEMDLDGIIVRRPQIVLVDELAHTNATGSRHPKRYMDVEELLSRGIDVYTTVNIQHIESLNDVVERISRVRVRETLPDKVLELADEIEFVRRVQRQSLTPRGEHRVRPDALRFAHAVVRRVPDQALSGRSGRGSLGRSCDRGSRR